MSLKNPQYEGKDGNTLTINETIVGLNGAAIPLPAGATVEFAHQKISPSEEAEVVSAASLVDAAGGIVEYTLTAAQTAMTPGQEAPDIYNAEFRVTAPGFDLTAPGRGFIRITINPDLST